MAFNAPIGTAEERASGIIWPGRWEDATGYDEWGTQGYHTGADLNLNFPHWDLNAHSDVYAMSGGQVTFAKLFPTGTWGKLVVIDHGIVDGKPLFSRYAHVENIQVEVGQPVTAGDPIANVGNGEGVFPYHLHFDISTTDMLKNKPGHWPGANRVQVHLHYVNPQEWLQRHVQSGIANLNTMLTQVWYVIATLGLRVREDHSTSARQVGALLYGARVSLNDSQAVEQDSYTWAQISGGRYNGDWIAMGKADQSDMFVSRYPPAV